MAKIKHIAISTQDVEGTARFYIDVFGLKEVGKVDSPGASGYYLSDGDLNLAILNFKNDTVAGAERGKDFSGIHHIGFQVESLDEIAARLADAGLGAARRRESGARRRPGCAPRRQRRGQVQRPGRRHGGRVRDRLGRHLTAAQARRRHRL